MSRWELSESEELIVQQFNSAPEKNYWYDVRYQSGYWDGTAKFFNQKTKILPAGLVPETIQALQAAGHHVELVTHPLREFPLRENAELNYSLDPDHQLRILESMCETERGIVSAATNAGKTKIAQAWCALFALKIIYLVPSKELLTQTVASFQRDTNLQIGWISADEGWNTGGDVTVCLVSSVAPRRRRGKRRMINQVSVDRFLALAGTFDAVIADECHHAVSASWSWILKELKNARFRFGLSGSPWNEGDRAAELRVKSYLGPTIATVLNKELVERGWSARPKIRMIELFAKAESEELEFLEVYEEFIVNNPHRNGLIALAASRLAQAQKSCLIVTTRIDHTELLSTMLSLNQIDHRVVTGELGKKDRKKYLEDFKESKFQVLISTVLGEGVDIPHLNALIIAAAGKSQKQLLQRVGRGIRKKHSGPNEVEIYDFFDKSHPILRRQSKDRLEIYRDQGFEVEICSTLPGA